MPDLFDKLVDDEPLTPEDEKELELIMLEPSLPVCLDRLLEPGYVEAVLAAYPLVDAAKALFPDREIVFEPQDLEIRVVSKTNPTWYVVFARAAANPDGSQVRVWLNG